jgi:hypothetical protein
MVMQLNTSFEKIKDFVQDQSNRALIIRPHDKGFKVNDYLILQEEDKWHVVDKYQHRKSEFFSKKFAVLYAILMSNSMSSQQFHLTYLDQQLAIAMQDQQWYQRLLQKECSEVVESLYQARLSRAKQVLEMVRQQVTIMEKSLALQ